MTARRRVDQLAQVHKCSTCHGSGIAPPDYLEVAAATREGERPIDVLAEKLRSIERRKRAAALSASPGRRTAREWASIEGDRPAVPLAVSLLEQLAAEDDPELVDACRAYLAAVS